MLAREIERDFRGREMVVVSLLNGTVMFLADLIRHLNLPLRLDFMGVSSYGLGTESGELVFTKELRLDVRGRDVLLVDDILDTGKTMSRVLPKIQALKPRRIKICVMLDKPSRRTKTSRRTTSALKSPTFLSSATGWILPNAIGTCRSSACCIRTSTNKPARRRPEIIHGPEAHQSARLVHDDCDGVGDFLQPETVSVAHGGLGRRPAIHAGPADS